MLLTEPVPTGKSYRRALWPLLIGWILSFFSPSSLTQLDIRFAQLQRLAGERFPEALPRITGWQQLLSSSRGLSEAEQLKRVNAFFHQQIRYRTDAALYGEADYWATPLETLGHGLGDCEDWAIAQYVSLRQLGIADDKLRLIYVRARIGGPSSSLSEAHMVLGYYATPASQPLILDSLVSSVQKAADRTDLTPVFSFNSAGLWAGQGAQKANASPTARLSRWRSVLDRMQAEGVVFR